MTGKYMKELSIKFLAELSSLLTNNENDLLVNHNPNNSTNTNPKMDNDNFSISQKKGIIEIIVIIKDVRIEIIAGYESFFPPKSILNPAFLY